MAILLPEATTKSVLDFYYAAKRLTDQLYINNELLDAGEPHITDQTESAEDHVKVLLNSSEYIYEKINDVEYLSRVAIANLT